MNEILFFYIQLASSQQQNQQNVVGQHVPPVAVGSSLEGINPKSKSSAQTAAIQYWYSNRSGIDLSPETQTPLTAVLQVVKQVS